MHCFTDKRELEEQVLTIFEKGKALRHTEAVKTGQVEEIFQQYYKEIFWQEMCREEAEEHLLRALDMQKFYENLKAFENKKYVCNMPKTFWNEELGQAIIRSDWSREALSFFMTCRSPVQNAHAHIDLMSFDFTALGKNMVCDPGIFCYRDDEDRKMFKSTAYHSTIVIDDKNQFEYIASFEFGPQKEGKIYRVEERDFYCVSSAFHSNYDPVMHYRHIALVDYKFVLVVDVLTGLRQNDVKRYFHLDYTEVEERGGVVFGKDSKENLVLYTFPRQRIQLLPGRLSDVNDVARNSTRVMYQGQYSGEQCFITLLIPQKGEIGEAVEIRKLSQKINRYKFTYGENYEVVVGADDINIKKNCE